MSLFSDDDGNKLNIVVIAFIADNTATIVASSVVGVVVLVALVVLFQFIRYFIIIIIHA